MKRLFLSLISLLLISVAFSSCKDDHDANVDDEKIYDLSWTRDLDSNMILLKTSEAEYSFADSVKLEFAGGGYDFYAQNDSKKIYIGWYPAGLPVDTFNVSHLSYVDKNDDVKISNFSGKVAVRKCKITTIKNAQDSILLEGVFHIKIDLQNGEARDLKGVFHYDGLRNVMLGL